MSFDVTLNVPRFVGAVSLNLFSISLARKFSSQFYGWTVSSPWARLPLLVGGVAAAVGLVADRTLKNNIFTHYKVDFSHELGSALFSGLVGSLSALYAAKTYVPSLGASYFTLGSVTALTTIVAVSIIVTNNLSNAVNKGIAANRDAAAKAAKAAAAAAKGTGATHP